MLFWQAMVYCALGTFVYFRCCTSLSFHPIPFSLLLANTRRDIPGPIPLLRINPPLFAARSWLTILSCPAIQRSTYHTRIYFQTFPPDASCFEPYAIHSHEAGLYLFQAVQTPSPSRHIPFLSPTRIEGDGSTVHVTSEHGPFFLRILPSLATSAYPDITAPDCRDAIKVLSSPQCSLSHIPFLSPSKIYPAMRLKHD